MKEVPGPSPLDGDFSGTLARLVVAPRRQSFRKMSTAHDRRKDACWRETMKETTMLVLSRKKNESIVINNDITIVVVEIRGDKVRLGVEAPKEVPVHRREVYDAIRRNDAAAHKPVRLMRPARTDSAARAFVASNFLRSNGSAPD